MRQIAEVLDHKNDLSRESIQQLIDERWNKLNIKKGLKDKAIRTFINS